MLNLLEKSNSQLVINIVFVSQCHNQQSIEQCKTYIIENLRIVCQSVLILDHFLNNICQQTVIKSSLISELWDSLQPQRVYTDNGNVRR